ncbi:hypothetical protein JCM1393_23100 [Clostridium carnis]
MSCGCSTLGNAGKSIVDLVRSKGKADLPLKNEYKINCSCGDFFTMKTLVDKCPNCKMTYGVTPCSQSDINNIKAAGINY